GAAGRGARPGRATGAWRRAWAGAEGRAPPATARGQAGPPDAAESRRADGPRAARARPLAAAAPPDARDPRPPRRARARDRAPVPRRAPPDRRAALRR